MQRTTKRRASTSIGKQIDRDTDRVGDDCHGGDLCPKGQRAWDVDDRIDGEKNRGERNDGAADRSNAQPNRIRANSDRSDKRDREHHEVYDSVENISGVINQLKRFLDARSDLARYCDHEGECSDEDDRVYRSLVTRMQTTKTTRGAIGPSLRPSVIANSQ